MTSKPTSMAAAKLPRCPHVAASDAPVAPSSSRNPRRPNPLHGIGLARFISILLVAQPLWAGCYHWVPIKPDFARGTTRQLDRVRFDDETVVEGASITGPFLTVSQAQDRPVAIDLIKTPTRVDLPQNEAAAIAGGETRHLDQVRVGDEVLTKATIIWPRITGYKKVPLTVDLRTRLVQREAVNPVAVVAGIVISGGLGVLFGWVIWAGVSQTLTAANL